MAETIRFRCPDCDRGLRVPEEVIGRTISCPFCKGRFDSSFKTDSTPSTDLIPADQPKQTTIGKWIPTAAGISASARGMVTGVSSHVRQVADVASGAAASAAKRTLAATAPIATTVVSAIVPGGGEFMAGKRKTGFFTFAAFLGSTTLAASTGGAWIAVPIAIRIYSGFQGAKDGIEFGDRIRKQLTEDANEAEVNLAAEEMRREAAKMSADQFERLMLEREEQELAKAKPSREVVLKKMG